MFVAKEIYDSRFAVGSGFWLLALSGTFFFVRWVRWVRWLFDDSPLSCNTEAKKTPEPVALPLCRAQNKWRRLTPMILPSMILRAAHNAARAASESLVMDETRVHVVIADVRRSDPSPASSAVKVPSGAGQARFRAAALSERCSFVNGATHSPVCGSSGCRTSAKWVKATSGVKTRWSATWSHRSRGGGTESSSGRVNWGTAARPKATGINKKPAVANRSSDVVIVSDEAGGQYNRWRSQGPLGRCVASEAVSAAGRKSDYGIKRARTRKPLWIRQSCREAVKGVSDSLLGAVLVMWLAT